MIDFIAQVFREAAAEHGAAALGVAAAGFFAGGFVKGAIGFALPMVAVAIGASVLPAEVAVALLAAPICIANLWQAGRDGVRAGWATARRFGPMIAALIVTLLAATQLLPGLNQRAFAAVMGAAVSGFALLQLIGWRPEVPPHRERLAQCLAGAVGGLFGGLSGIWGPPMLMTLLAFPLQKADFIRALGVAWFVASIPFLIGHALTGVLNAQTLTLSAAMLAPALLGMALGRFVQDRLEAEALRKAILMVLIVAGANFLRRAALG